jgi:hypothetical protein
MKKRIIIIFVGSIFLLNNCLFAQNVFHKLFNISQNSHNFLNDVVKTFDNGFACVTSSGSILKVDSTLEVKFYKKLSNAPAYFNFQHIKQTTDSGFIIAQIMFDNSAMGMVLKVDKAGNYQWSKKYHVGSNQLWDILITKNNGFYILSDGCSGMSLIKCNGLGDILWQKTYASPNLGGLKIVNHSADKILILAIRGIIPYKETIDILTVDTSGNFLGLKEFQSDSNKSYFISDALKTKDNELSILVNYQLSANNSYSNITLHFDSLNNFLWAKDIAFSDTLTWFKLYSFTETHDKGYLYTGYIRFVDSLVCNTVYIKTDSLNNIEWSRNFNMKDSLNSGIKVLNKDMNNYVFCSNTNTISAVKLDQFGYGFCKTDSVQLLTNSIIYYDTTFSVIMTNSNFLYTNEILSFLNIELKTEDYCSNSSSMANNEVKDGFILYPNPANESITYQCGGFVKNQILFIYNLEGRSVFQQSILKDRTVIDISSLAKGLYFIKVITNEGSVIRKFVKE